MGTQSRMGTVIETQEGTRYRIWTAAVRAAGAASGKTLFDRDILKELEAMGSDPEAIREAFYRDLTFGTGGLRGILGAGAARMNVYTVAKASQGLADYIKDARPARSTAAPAAIWADGPVSPPAIAVSYDSRINSLLFAQTAAAVFAANGLTALLYPRLMPTPCLSFAVSRLGCAAGVMVTASHNPASYNGYKVYGPDGCQITTGTAAQIQAAIKKLDIFSDVAWIPFEDGVAQGLIRYIPEDVTTDFVEAVKAQSLLEAHTPVRKDLSIVYSPLNGAGLEPVLRVLKESGYRDITVVKEQAQPDGTFPTCPYPNPEESKAMALGLCYARACQADLLLATDPDCDRVGIAAKGSDGRYVLLSANETGLLLLDYIASRRTAMGTMPKDPLLFKTIVTTDLARSVAAHYGMETVDVLTGFKFIGEQIGLLEAAGALDRYVFGFEESYGYLSGTYVRDKDGVGATFLICEMAAFYAAKGISLPEKLEALYRTYGYCLDTQHPYTFAGAAGAERMGQIMGRLREGIGQVGPRRVLSCTDYRKGIDGLPAADVLRFRLDEDCSLVVRPSGTEPKIKVYISVRAKDRETAKKIEKELAAGLSELFR